MYPPKIGIERTFLYYVKALDKLQKSIDCKFMNYICTLSKNILPKKKNRKSNKHISTFSSESRILRSSWRIAYLAKPTYVCPPPIRREIFVR